MRGKYILLLLGLAALDAALLWFPPPKDDYVTSVRVFPEAADTGVRGASLTEINRIISLYTLQHSSWPASLSDAIQQDPDLQSIEATIRMDPAFAQGTLDRQRQRLAAYLEGQYQYARRPSLLDPASSATNTAQSSPDGGEDLVLIERKPDSANNRLFITRDGRKWIAHEF